MERVREKERGRRGRGKGKGESVALALILQCDNCPNFSSNLAVLYNVIFVGV